MPAASRVTSGDRDRFLAIYAFLRKALLRVSDARPFRGPSHFEEGDYCYLNSSDGEISEFHGTEQVCLQGTQVYALRYGGGNVR